MSILVVAKCNKPRHMIRSYDFRVTVLLYTYSLGSSCTCGYLATIMIGQRACRQLWSGGGEGGGEQLSSCGRSDRIMQRSSDHSALLTGNYTNAVVACGGERQSTTTCFGVYDYSATAEETKLSTSISTLPPGREMRLSTSIPTPCSYGGGGRVVAIGDSPASRPCARQGARIVGATCDGAALPPAESSSRIIEGSNQELVSRAHPDDGAKGCSGDEFSCGALRGAHGKDYSPPGSLVAASPEESSFGAQRCDKAEERACGEGERVTDEDARREPVTISSEDEKRPARRSMTRSTSSPLAGDWGEGGHDGKLEGRYADVGGNIGVPPSCSTSNGAPSPSCVKSCSTSDRCRQGSAGSEIGGRSTEDDSSAIESTGGQGSAALAVIMAPIRFCAPGLVNGVSAVQGSRTDPLLPTTQQHQHQNRQQRQRQHWLHKPKRRGSSDDQGDRAECTVS